MKLVYVEPERIDIAILAAADSLLSICAIQTEDPRVAIDRAIRALAHCVAQGEREAHERELETCGDGKHAFPHGIREACECGEVGARIPQ